MTHSNRHYYTGVLAFVIDDESRSAMAVVCAFDIINLVIGITRNAATFTTTINGGRQPVETGFSKQPPLKMAVTSEPCANFDAR